MSAALPQIVHIALELHPDQPPLSHSERDIVLGALRYFEGDTLCLHAWAILDRSAHAVFSPTAGAEAQAIAGRWAGVTTRILGDSLYREGPLWRGPVVPRILASVACARTCCAEVIALPRSRFPSMRSYAWVSAGVVAAEVLDGVARAAYARERWSTSLS